MKRKFNFKVLVVLASMVLVLGTVVDGTLAYLITNSESVINEFEAAHVGSKVTVNSDGEYIVAPDDLTNTTVYLRAAVVVNAVDSNGNVIWQKNQHMTVDHDNKWVEHGVYYYYQMEVAPDGEATPLKITASVPDGYDARIQVLAEAIQSKPEGQVTWDKNGMN